MILSIMSLNQLPDEIIRHILFCLSPLDTLHGFGKTSRRLVQLSNEGLIWRFHCVQSFKYWNPSHGFKTLLRLPAPQTDWKRLFLFRCARNKRISRLLEQILRTKVGRLKRFAKITEYGYDAKDFLLEHCNADESFEDVLARRYYAHAILDAIHRRIAIEEWASLPNTVEMQNPLELEKALGSFEMFVLHGQPGDLDDISTILGNLTVRFRLSHPQLDQWSTRKKALALNKWMRAERLTGLQNPERDYRNLRNCLIGQALQQEDHESLPIISSAIFCCIAQRIGLAAQCCAFPSHVHVVVSPPLDRDLDGKLAIDTNEPREMMYLDPYGSDGEIPAAELTGFLARFGWQNSAAQVMAPVSTSSIVIRTASNIRLTYGTFLEHQDRDTAELTRLLHGPGPMNVNACFYASLWATLILMPTADFDWEEHFDRFMDRFCRTWPEDAWLVEKYVMPRYESFASQRQRFIRPGGNEVDDAWRVLRFTQQADDLRPSIFRRSEGGNAYVSFKIGQVFRHRRYGWLGVITGWTDQGTRSLTNNGPRVREGTQDLDESDSDIVTRLRHPEKTYFTYIRTTTAERYVIAEANVEVVHDPSLIRETPFIYAGKFFKRFDPGTCRFISNIKEEYPDD